jgi:hypothetical protein
VQVCTLDRESKFKAKDGAKDGAKDESLDGASAEA